MEKPDAFDGALKRHKVVKRTISVHVSLDLHNRAKEYFNISTLVDAAMRNALDKLDAERAQINRPHAPLLAMHAPETTAPAPAHPAPHFSVTSDIPPAYLEHELEWHDTLPTGGRVQDIYETPRGTLTGSIPMNKTRIQCEWDLEGNLLDPKLEHPKLYKLRKNTPDEQHSLDAWRRGDGA